MPRKSKYRAGRLIIAMSLALLATTIVHAQRDFSDVEIRTHKVADSVYMLEGAGGNIGLLIGADGPIMIDDQFAPLTDKILAAIGQLNDRPVKFVINTHLHGDHTGGNENLGKRGAIIVAHNNVRERMSKEQFSEAFNRTTPPAPKDALPVVTFTESMQLHLNDETMHLFHVENAHTDGDTIIFFENANVFHMGDCYFNGLYPFIDPDNGGSIYGMIDACESVLDHCNEDTKIIPGHGPLSNPDELEEFVDMLVTIRDRIDRMIDEGKTAEQVIAAKPTADYDDELGGGFLNPDQFVGIVYRGMTLARQNNLHDNHDDDHMPGHDHGHSNGHDHGAHDQEH